MFFQNIVTAVRQETIDTAFDGGDRWCGGQCRTLRKNSIN